MADQESPCTTIALKRSTVEALKDIGKKGETYDQIISRLIPNNKPQTVKPV